ncbi:MAG: alpha/beta fold hydrolase [Alphaproteobacteria bacterium]
MKKEFINLTVDGVSPRLSVLRRDGSGPPVVFLHGFGAGKEDYADFAMLPRFKDRAFMAYDAPGFGETECSDLEALSIPVLSRTVASVINHYGVSPCHLIGHSMGGLSALMFAHSNPEAVLSFTNIEGNLAPEDCFLSRQIIDFPEADGKAFLENLAENIRAVEKPSSELYAANLCSKTRPGAVAPIFRSMVELSDNTPLMEYFLGLPMPKIFVYGSENRSLSYLDQLRQAGARLAEIPGSGHFPMYANPPALWQAIGDFIEDAEQEQEHE